VRNPLNAALRIVDRELQALKRLQKEILDIGKKVTSKRDLEQIEKDLVIRAREILSASNFPMIAPKSKSQIRRPAGD
jgi:hypothetical protein